MNDMRMGNIKTWKEFFLAHARAISIWIFLCLGAVSAWIAYAYLFLPYEPAEVLVQDAEVTVHTQGLERISEWSIAKQQKGAVLPRIPNIFYIPPSL